MMDFEQLQITLYHKIPEFFRERLEKQAKYAKMENHERTTVNIYGFFLLIVLLFNIFAPVSGTFKAGATIIAVPILFWLPYIVISIYANQRKEEIEQVLPVALNLISSNMESGLTVDKAFLLSAREEFGPLAKDLKKAAMKMFSGKSVNQALTELSKSTNSELFEETLNLLMDGIQTGGKVAQLLESSAKDVQKSLRLREEIAANVKMYSLFIIIAAVIGAPILFSVSVHLTETTGSMWESQSIDFENLPDQGSFTPQQPSFKSEFFANFALAAIILSNFFAALLISEIKNGNMKNGIKYAPIYAIIGSSIFFLSNVVINILM